MSKVLMGDRLLPRRSLRVVLLKAPEVHASGPSRSTLRGIHRYPAEGARVLKHEFSLIALPFNGHLAMRAFILFGRGEGVEPSCHSQMDEQGAGLFFMGKEDQEILAFSLDAKDLQNPSHIERVFRDSQGVRRGV